MTGYDVQEAASSYRIGRYKNLGIEPQYGWSDIDAAFAAGAAWQKERDTAAHNTLAEVAEAALDGGIAFQDEVRNALGTLGEGMAELLQCTKALQVAGLRGADRGVALLKHAQENGDIARRVEALVGDKFGVLLDVLKHVGETTEAVLDQVMTPEIVNVAETTEPMHADVKGAPSASIPIEDVSDETLRALAVSGQISDARYYEEYNRRRYVEKLNTGSLHIGIAPKERDGIVTWQGKPYMLLGGELHPLRVMP